MGAELATSPGWDFALGCLSRPLWDDLPEGLRGPFDKLLAVNTVGVWHEPAARFADLAGRMRPGGGVALVSQPRCPGATAETTIAAGCDLAAYLGEAGFSDLRSETLNLRPAVVCVLGSRQWNPSGGPC